LGIEKTISAILAPSDKRPGKIKTESQVFIILGLPETIAVVVTIIGITSNHMIVNKIYLLF
jgi:hypothetical protein